MSFDIIILTNGPGEISAWVKPAVRKINESLPGARVIIALVPCPYASGEENKIATELEGVSYVLTDSETSFYLLSKKLPEGFNLQSKGIILHLGGDQFFSVMFGWRTKFPTVVYTEKHVFWQNFIQKYLISDKNLYVTSRMKGIKSEKLALVGNLMVDAAISKMNPLEIRERLGLSNLKPVVTLLPGSKPFKVKYSTPFLLKIADYIAQKRPDVQFVISQSPYTPLYQIVGSVTKEKYIQALDGVSARFGQDKNGNVLVTDQGTTISIIPPDFQYEAFQISDVAVTLPGTNTAELAVLGIPMVTIFPLKKLEHIPIEGLLGRISDIPWVGKYLKSFLIRRGLKALKFISLPNQKAGYEITPEIVGEVLSVDVASKVVHIVDKPEERRNISLNLKRIMGTGGASQNIVTTLVEVLLNKYPDLEIIETNNNFSDWTKRKSDAE